MTDSIWKQLKDASPFITLGMGILAILYGSIIWGLGPIRPQTQVELDQQKAIGVDLGLRVAVLESRMNALPRASDYAEWVAHLSRLDAVYEGQRDKITALSYDSKDLAAKYQSLTTTRK